jgi:hypothetical protein
LRTSSSHPNSGHTAKRLHTSGWMRSTRKLNGREKRRRSPIEQLAQSLLGRGDHGNWNCNVAREGAVSSAKQNQNRSVVPIRHGEVNMPTR